LRTTSVTVEFPDDVLQLVDYAAKLELLSRSAYVRSAVVKALRQDHPQQLDRVLQAPKTISQLTRSVSPGTPSPGLPHKHANKSKWAQKHSLYQKAREEVQHVYDTAHLDRDKGEVIARRESVLLDVEAGEVLRQGIRYQRTFDVFNRR